MNKYNAKKTYVDGIAFDSKKEAKRYQELKLLERGGVISDLDCQVKFELIPKQEGERAVSYYADFVYTEAQNGLRVVEDVKGYRQQPVWVIKRKLMLWVHGIRVVEV